MKSGARWAAAAARPADQILGFVIDNGSAGATAAMIAALTRTSTAQARQRLETLVRRKTLVRNGDRYHLALTREASHDA